MDVSGMAKHIDREALIVDRIVAQASRECRTKAIKKLLEMDKEDT